MKSITTQYQGFLTPPAPFAVLTIETLDGAVSIPNQPAQLDMAADWTVLPQSIVNQLGVAATGTVDLMGFGGVPAQYPVFQIKLALPTFSPIVLEVTAHGNEPWILLGRDVLNLYKITLDGPQLKLTIEEP
jgi:hypothetical protein